MRPHPLHPRPAEAPFTCQLTCEGVPCGKISGDVTLFVGGIKSGKGSSGSTATGPGSKLSLSSSFSGVGLEPSSRKSSQDSYSMRESDVKLDDIADYLSETEEGDLSLTEADSDDDEDDDEDV